MQIVTLSTRPDVFAETRAHVRHFMPWADRALVIAPQRVAVGFEGSDDVTVLTDEALTGLGTNELAAMDHMTRNFTIRGALGEHDAVDDVFVMGDDDARPLKAVDEGFFRVDGRDRGFFFYDLDAWPGDDTPFDTGQHNVRELLAYLGYERLAYGSHMPQIIRKAHLAEAWAIARRLTHHAALDEWALYFNVARALHPDDFGDPEPFRTLCWPQYPGEWAWWVRPPEYVFENFYPDLYRPGHLFDGIPTALEPEAVERHNVEKVLRWSAFGRRVERLDFPDDIANPWTGTSAVRRVGFGVLRRAQQAFGYVSFSQRHRVTELQGTVARLEDDVRRLRGRED
jgi:hypothetical protein